MKVTNPTSNNIVCKRWAEAWG